MHVSSLNEKSRSVLVRSLRATDSLATVVMITLLRGSLGALRCATADSEMMLASNSRTGENRVTHRRRQILPGIRRPAQVPICGHLQGLQQDCSDPKTRCGVQYISMPSNLETGVRTRNMDLDRVNGQPARFQGAVPASFLPRGIPRSP